jgi:hypothetical protein
MWWHMVSIRYRFVPNPVHSALFINPSFLTASLGQETSPAEVIVPSALVLRKKFSVHLFANAFLCILAPLDAGREIIVDNKSAVVAGHLEVV